MKNCWLKKIEDKRPNRHSVGYWLTRIGEPLCGYYDGRIGILEDVGVDETNLMGIKIKVSGRWRDAAWCSFDTDEERWLHPDIVEKQDKDNGKL